MKKILLIFCSIVTMFLLSGCDKTKNVINGLDKIQKMESYYMEGKLTIINNEDSYDYSVKVSYKEEDNYKVELVNLINNHKQIILKNEDGVYVLTPSLNKSFKFQSDWPYNNSQIYLVHNIIDDIKNDEKRTIEESDKGFIITSKVQYSNNNKLTKQKVYFDKNINKVEVLNDENTPLMTMVFEKVEYNKNFNNNYFDLDTSMEVGLDIELKDKIDEIVYPMFVPKDTALTNQSKVETSSGERVILTFAGDKSFMLVESTLESNNEMLPVYGDLQQVNDVIGVINDSSLTWYGNETEYYLTSDDMSQEELLTVANSLGTIMVGK